MTYKQAYRKSLRAYRAAVKAAERGQWERAEALTNGEQCPFCKVAGPGLVESGDCHATCPATELCERDYVCDAPSGELVDVEPYMIARYVVCGRITAESALDALRRVLDDLEALNV